MDHLWYSFVAICETVFSSFRISSINRAFSRVVEDTTNLFMFKQLQKTSS